MGHTARLNLLSIVFGGWLDEWLSISFVSFCQCFRAIYTLFVRFNYITKKRECSARFLYGPNMCHIVRNFSAEICGGTNPELQLQLINLFPRCSFRAGDSRRLRSKLLTTRSAAHKLG